MVLYKLLLVFEVKARDSETSRNVYEDTAEFENLEAAENFLEAQRSMMISEFSLHSLEWTMVEKSVVSTQEQKESDHMAVLVE